jgi:GAF domain-containing protein
LTLLQLAKSLSEEPDTGDSVVSAAHATASTLHLHDLATAPVDLSPYLPASETVSAYLTVVAFLKHPFIRWAQRCPGNYLARLKLIEAETYHVLILRRGEKQHVLAAMEAYDASIAAAHQHGWLNEEAIGYELAGRFYHAIGRTRECMRYLRRAYEVYTVYNSVLKTEQLYAEFKDLFQKLEAQGKIRIQRLRSKRSRMIQAMANDNGASSAQSMDSNHHMDETDGPIPIATASAPAANSNDSILGHPFSRDPCSSSSSSSSTSGSSLSDAPPFVHLHDSPQPGVKGPFPGIDLDLATVMRACQVFSVETDFNLLMDKLIWIVLQYAGASRGRLLIPTTGTAAAGQTNAADTATAAATSTSSHHRRPTSRSLDQWKVLVSAKVEEAPQPHPKWLVDSLAGEVVSGLPPHMQHARNAKTISPTPIRLHKADATSILSSSMPLTVLNYLVSSKTTIVLSEKELAELPFARDPYFAKHTPHLKACLCVPILKQNQLVGMLYLENDHTTNAFSPDHVQVLKLLCSQAALSMENARLYQEMKAACEAAEQGSKTKSEFLTNMSHEIRTPMNAVIGISRLLADTNLSLEQQQYVSMINSSGQLLLSIINDVLDLSRIESGKLELERTPFSLLECIENSVQLCWNAAYAKRLDLAYEIATDVPDQISGDSTHLMQILINLLSNGQSASVHAVDAERDTQYARCRLAFLSRVREFCCVCCP